MTKNKKLLIFEFLFNGTFSLCFLLLRRPEYVRLISLESLTSFVNLLSYISPVVVSIIVLIHLFSAKSLENFFRQYIFSLVILVPMLIVLGDVEFIFWLTVVHLFSSMVGPTSIEQTEQEIQTFKLNFIEKLSLAPSQIVLITFALLILIGTFLLMLPFSLKPGVELNFVDALFMATSATCVTGLSTVPVNEFFSFSGQVILLVLIQIGALGYMTLYSSLTILMGKAMGLKQQVLMQGLLDISSIEDMFQLVFDIVKYTFIIELIGGLILSTALSLEGYELSRAIYWGFFHSISAFCNAGFSLFDDSLVSFQTNYLVNTTVMILIVLGGLGFIVLKDLEQVVRRNKKIENLTLHSKIVLTTTFTLIVVVAGYIFLSEYLNYLGDYSLLDQVLISLFQSITTRTAGFNTVELNKLQMHTIYFISLIMFIGASPGSTGGGIKTTTFALLVQSVRSTLKGSDTVEFFQRRIPNILVVRAISLIIMALFTVSLFILIMVWLEPEQSFISLFFEVVSAFGTVGLSLGVTPFLSVSGKVALTFLMLIGRVGPLTLALAVSKSQKSKGRVKYPTSKVMIG